MRKSFKLFIGVLGLAALAVAQAQDTAYQLGYAANLSAGDSAINLTNSGANGGFDPGGDICANVYVFAEDQQLISCCTCLLTPNHLKTLSVQNNLINNTLTPGVPTAVTIGLVSTLVPTGGCNAATAGLGSNALATGLVAWGTTVHAQPGGGFATGDYDVKSATLSAGELTKMTSYCGFIRANGSGYGICGSCQQGAAGASRQ